MNIYKFSIILLLLITACKENRNINDVPEIKENHSPSDSLTNTNNYLENESDDATDSFILIDYLIKFNGLNEYYLPLTLKSEYSDTLWHSIENAKTRIVYQEELESRYEIPDSTIKRHFWTSGMDQLLLINKDQEIFDSILRNRFEFYDASIESFYVATYKIDENYGDSIIAVSKNKFTETKINKSPKIYPTEKITLKEIEKRFGSFDDKFSESTLFHNQDTITIVSIGNYSKNKYTTLLLWNNELKDSISNDHLAILNISPIPFATNQELTYIYLAGKPDTDWYWNALLGIDTIEQKFIWYDKNKINR